MKINVIGTGGSGKSTLSQRLAARFNVPCIQLDQLFWRANWQGSTDEEMRSRLREKMEESPDGWIIDGNYFRHCPFKWEAADLVIWLDYGFFLTMYRVVCRSIWRAWSQTEIWPGTGNRESFWKTFFTRDSMIFYTFSTYWNMKTKIEGFMADEKWKNVRIVRLRSPRETEEFLETIGKEE